jgi:hypothetical protein
MKLVDQFRSFLDDTVNLNTTRLAQLQKSVDALKAVIKGSTWAPPLITFREQGSWALETIIKPVDGRAFDADLLVIVKPVAGWDAKQYLSTLRAIFAEHGTYEDKVTRSSHCVTIEYAGERKVDLVPCIFSRNARPGYEVCNFNSNQFERSEPDAYTVWLRERNSWTGSNGLKKVTRLLKYLRDVKGTFTCPSIVLTTLLGMQVAPEDKSRSTSFVDLPTSMKTIIGRLDDWLQARELKPVVINPVLASESFSRLWDDDQYSNFREKFSLYRTWIDDAFDEEDPDESVGKWRRVFGEDFAKDAVAERAVQVSESASALHYANRTGATTDSHDDWVGLVMRFGISVLPAWFSRLPHKQRPPWRSSPHGRFALRVSATLHASKNGTKVRDVVSGSGPLPKDGWLRFSVRESSGVVFPEDKYRIRWRITNTDREALRANALRGGFEEPNDGTARWEHLQYRGVHSAEVFVVRRKENTLVGQSDPFYVIIE